MKKIIPLISLLGASTLIVSITTNAKTEKKEAFIQHFNSFHQDIDKLDKIDTTHTSIALNKYALKLSNELENLNVNNNHQMPLSENQQTDNIIQTQELKDNVQTSVQENSISSNHLLINTNHQQEEQINNLTSTTNNEINSSDLDNLSNVETINETESDENNAEYEENTEIEKINQISTLYTLSNDIEQSCDDFCELKEELSNAIIETQNLINKVQTKEIELTNEQRLFLTQQAQELKNLGRQLSSSTTELSISLSDLNSIMAMGNPNMDKLSLKYLVVLDNLINGNEMLQSGIETVNLMNQMFNMSAGSIPPNNTGRILYGFQQNNNPPVVKDYLIDENGELKENNMSENTQENQNVENINTEVDINSANKNSSGIDTYQNTKLKSNIDTYANNNIPRNIDSFFNTALLDNDFMYGNGNNGLYGMANPHMQGYANYERNNTINSDNRLDNTQNNNPQNDNKKAETKKEKKEFQLKKNIDTYKDENEPDIKTKLGNIKNSVTGFFSKFKKDGGNKKVENPVYRYNGSNEE